MFTEKEHEELLMELEKERLNEIKKDSKIVKKNIREIKKHIRKDIT